MVHHFGFLTIWTAAWNASILREWCWAVVSRCLPEALVYHDALGLNWIFFFYKGTPTDCRALFVQPPKVHRVPAGGHFLSSTTPKHFITSFSTWRFGENQSDYFSLNIQHLHLKTNKTNNSFISSIFPQQRGKSHHPPTRGSFTRGYGRTGMLHLCSKWGGKQAEAAVAAVGMVWGPQCHSRLRDELSGGHRWGVRLEMAGWSARLSDVFDRVFNTWQK